MEPNLDPLNTFLTEADLDGYLIDAPGTVADQRYVTGFGAVDPFTSLYTGGAVHVLVRGLDRGLAETESRAATVRTGADYDRQAKVEAEGSTAGEHRVVEAFLAEFDVSAVGVPARFPLARADALRAENIVIQPDEDGVIGRARAVKTSEEIEHIRATQRATERAMEAAEKLLAGAAVEGDTLVSNGEALTSERVKRRIEQTLVEAGCASPDTIVAGGADAANPHHRGDGPLPANEPIVIDIFPQDGDSKYHADMTRTFCVEEPSDQAAEWFSLTRDAQAAALDVIASGVSAADVHGAVCDVYEDAGIPTTRSAEDPDTGFIHGTGHGIGLEVHERPSVNAEGPPLEAGHVVTIEPGVYDPAVGGIRIEDLVVVTEQGCENLTEYHKEFVLE